MASKEPIHVAADKCVAHLVTQIFVGHILCLYQTPVESAFWLVQGSHFWPDHSQVASGSRMERLTLSILCGSANLASNPVKIILPESSQSVIPKGSSLVLLSCGPLFQNRGDYSREKRPLTGHKAKRQQQRS